MREAMPRDRAGTVLAVMLAGLFLLGAISTAAAAPSFHRGFNTWPWLYRARTLDGVPGQFNFKDTFPYLHRFTPVILARVRRTGVDVLRIPVEPGPLMMADDAQFHKLSLTILGAARTVTRLGMSAIVDLHPHDGVKGWGAADILKSPDQFARYRAVVLKLAQAIAASRDDRIVLELMNEPQDDGTVPPASRWLAVQPQLVKDTRQVAPNLRLVVCGDGGGSLDGLLHLEPGSFDDPNILYSFHYYIPAVVTHQGATWGEGMGRYVSGIVYPPDPENEAADAERVRSAVMADASLSVQKRQDLAKTLGDKVHYYYAHYGKADFIKTDMSRLVGWQRTHNIPSARIVMGEFGVYRPGADMASAARFAQDVRSSAESLGFAWIYWNYAPFDENGLGFSLLKMRGSAPNSFEPALVKALGLDMP